MEQRSEFKMENDEKIRSIQEKLNEKEKLIDKYKIYFEYHQVEISKNQEINIKNKRQKSVLISPA